MVSGCPAVALRTKVPELDVVSWSPAIVGQIASPMINLPTTHGFEFTSLTSDWACTPIPLSPHSKP